MSVFDDEVAADLPGILSDAGDPADYVGDAFTAEGIMVVIDRDWTVYDQDQLPMSVNTISVMLADVPTSSREDTITIGEKTWKVWRILEDDGHVRRLEVG
ncbi:hypothetical protein SAMN05216571_101409 [Onishia taeanensis]|uniref:ATP-binding sugar transporter Gifsy-2 n=1 Tax=Onishia taeanensis TaxID=284577 RepID=A0A1G7NHJ5_9GAMM|nr:hypothetical protein [Halomonas taeanensis]SDF72720.1 hypothetical protein SAMN05216571_101409 [Halomonas taeanensis]